MLRNRSVVEIMVIMFTGLVAFIMVMAGVVVCIVEIQDPEADTAPIVQSLTNLTSGILGALLGLLAGKSATTGQLGTRPDGTADGVSREP